MADGRSVADRFQVIRIAVVIHMAWVVQNVERPGAFFRF